MPRINSPVTQRGLIRTVVDASAPPDERYRGAEADVAPPPANRSQPTCSHLACADLIGRLTRSRCARSPGLTTTMTTSRCSTRLSSAGCGTGTGDGDQQSAGDGRAEVVCLGRGVPVLGLLPLAPLALPPNRRRAARPARARLVRPASPAPFAGEGPGFAACLRTFAIGCGHGCQPRY